MFPNSRQLQENLQELLGSHQSPSEAWALLEVGYCTKAQQHLDVKQWEKILLEY